MKIHNILDLVKERSKIERLFKKETKMVAASFCKRENSFAYLAASIKGVNRHRYIKKNEEKHWKELAKEWKFFSKGIARWVSINKELENMFRMQAKERLVELPKAKKRGKTS